MYMRISKSCNKYYFILYLDPSERNDYYSIYSSSIFFSYRKNPLSFLSKCIDLFFRIPFNGPDVE